MIKQMSRQYGEGITVAQTEIGKTYLVINGAYSFKVIEKSEIGTRVELLSGDTMWLSNRSTIDEYTLEEHD